jgi:hypothetical protein
MKSQAALRDVLHQDVLHQDDRFTEDPVTRCAENIRDNPRPSI